MHQRSTIIPATILLLLTTLAPAQDSARRIQTAGGARRVALVIGNGKYPWKPLKNPINDAQAVAAKLKQIGFDGVTLLTDATRDQMTRAAAKFVDDIRPGDTAFLYYSGHGIEVKGQNYLLPINFPSNASETEASYEALSAQKLVKDLEQAAAQVRIVILDACRDNPLRATRSGAGGLMRMEAEGTLIVFATGANRTADDNTSESNGLFTKYLLRELGSSGVSLGQMAKRVQLSVSEASAKRQIPAIYDNLLQEVYWNGRASTPVAPENRMDAASEAWALIRGSNSPDDFDQFARTFPNSDLAATANMRAVQLRRTVAPAPATVNRGPQVGDVKVNPKDGQRYVWIPAGQFQMGCSSGDNECQDWEKPAHEVTISKGYWMGQTAVTVGAWKKVGLTMPPEPKFGDRALNEGWKDEQQPIVNVTWLEAKQYCEATGMRLPTEAEWEYAARAGSGAARYGNLNEIAWYADNSGKEKLDSAGIWKNDAKNYGNRLNANGNGPHGVGLKSPNSWKLYDMLGNVWQWTADWYGEKYYEQQEGRDPIGPPGGTRRVLRGGSWYVNPSNLRVSLRNGNGPGDRIGSIGLRCVGE